MQVCDRDRNCRTCPHFYLRYTKVPDTARYSRHSCLRHFPQREVVHYLHQRHLRWEGRLGQCVLQMIGLELWNHDACGTQEATSITDGSTGSWGKLRLASASEIFWRRTAYAASFRFWAEFVRRVSSRATAYPASFAFWGNSRCTTRVARQAALPTAKPLEAQPPVRSNASFKGTLASLTIPANISWDSRAICLG